jgi:DNA polymerase-1
MSKLLLFDAYSLIYRAFYAIRELTGPGGQPVNAIYGFTRMVRKLIADHRPTHAAVVFDLGAPQYRLSLLPSYKEHRPPTPPALDVQVPMIRNLLAALRVPVVELEGEEADDIIATLAVQAARDGAEALIVSNDKDFTQIVSDRIGLVRPDSKETGICGPAGVEEKYGVRPDQMLDYLCLLGDAVDNIPGVPGVGEKTTVELLRQFQTVDNLVTSAASITKPKLRENILAAAERLRTNRALIALRCEIGLPCRWDTLTVQSPDMAQLTPLLRECGFKSLLAELERESQQTGDLFGGR